MPPVVRAPLLVLALAAVGGSAVRPDVPGPGAGEGECRHVVRGTAGDHSPETGKLEMGNRVTVLSAEGNDWLAIQPPQGAISWIPWTLVEPQGEGRAATGRSSPPFNAVVTPDDGASIRPGSMTDAKPLGVQKTKLPKGTIVQVIGPKVKVKADGDELEANWYPIIAPKDDVRYVRRDAVEWVGAAPGSSFVVKAGGTTSKPLPGTTVEPGKTLSDGKGDFGPSASGRRAPAVPDQPATRAKPTDWPNNYPLWREAEKARGAGDTKQARELYTKLAQEVSREGAGQDNELATLCYDRIYNALGGNTGGGGGSAWRPPEAGPAVKADPPKTDQPKAATAGRTVEGSLHAANAKLDGKWSIYLLADEKRVVRHYVISERGRPRPLPVGKWVEVTGNRNQARTACGATRCWWRLRCGASSGPRVVRTTQAPERGHPARSSEALAGCPRSGVRRLSRCYLISIALASA